MFIRLLTWSIQRIGVATFLSLLLLYIALGGMLRGLSSVMRDFDLWLLTPLTIVGVLAGWGLAKTRLPGWLAGLIALAGGGQAIIIRLGRLDEMLLAVANALFNLIRSFLAGPLTAFPDVTPVLSHLNQMRQALRTLFIRLFEWGAAMMSGQPIYDPVVTALIWSLALWSVAVWAGWTVRRHAGPLLALLPAGALLAAVLAHSRESLTPLLLFLLATLLLMALVRQQANEQAWQTNKVGFSPEIRTDLTVAVILLSLAFVVIAASAPSLSLRRLTQVTQDFFRERIIPADELAARSLGLQVNAEPAAPLDSVRRGGLPRNHLLGAGPELSDQVVMVVRTNDPPPLTPDETPPRYYWRSLTYDRYTGRGWVARQTETIAYQAGETIPGPDFANQRLLQQNVRLTENAGGLLYAAGELVTADHPFSVAWRSEGDIFGTTTDALAYRAESRLPLVTAAALRAIGNDYPAWVRRRYLSLPDSTPRRVHALARDLTAAEPTPYDRAKAIEGYLRAFPYNLDLPAPPLDRDLADYFLFDLQQGYCDYYATSMVVLARSAGLPARLAVGYINGTYDRANHRYLVSEAEAHSWVEIYFPDIGWVAFEPTGGRPALERDQDAVPIVPPELETPLADFSVEEETGGALWRWTLPAGLALLLLAFGLWSTIDRWRLRRLTPALTVAALHHRLYEHARRLHTPLVAGDTPYQFAASLIEHVTNLAMRKVWGGYVAGAPGEVQELIALYIRASYSPHRLDDADQVQAIRLWQRLRRRLWLAWLVGRPEANERRPKTGE